MLKAIASAGFQAMKGGVDLNGKSRFWQSSGFFPGGCHEHRQNPVCTAHGLPALDDICPVCPAVWRRSWHPHTALCRAVPGHGVRSIDLSGESARYRGVSFGASGEALPHGLARTGSTLDAGRCQRVARLAYLLRVRSAADRQSTGAVCQRGLRRGTGQYRLCARCHDHRSVSVDVSGGRFAPPRPQ